jgi:uncharacterized membrane protein
MDLLKAAAHVVLIVAASTIRLGLQYADFRRLFRHPQLLAIVISCRFASPRLQS